MSAPYIRERHQRVLNEKPFALVVKNYAGERYVLSVHVDWESVARKIKNNWYLRGLGRIWDTRTPWDENL